VIPITCYSCQAHEKNLFLNSVKLPKDLQNAVEKDAFTPYLYPVFAVHIEKIYQPDRLHYFFVSLLRFLLTEEALLTVGLFRIPGSADEIRYYMNLFNEGKEVILKCSSHDAVGLLKEFLRKLPEPLIPGLFNAQIPLLIEQYKTNNAQLLSELKFIVQSLPPGNFAVFRVLVLLMVEVTKQSAVNKMTVDNIIKCIVPTIGCHPAIFLYTMMNFEYFFGPLDAK